MSHALATRATSIGVSALLMSSLVLAALLASYTIREIDIGAPPAPVEVFRPPQPPPPPAVDTPRTPLTSSSADVAPLPAIDPPVTADPAPPYFGNSAAAGPVEITAPRWLHRPGDLARYYPSRAIERNIEGEALLDCLVSTVGTLRCSVVSESPRGWGLGDAALRIARDHRMAPAMSHGTAVEGHYRMRVPFEIRE